MCRMSWRGCCILCSFIAFWISWRRLRRSCLVSSSPRSAVTMRAFTLRNCQACRGCRLPSTWLPTSRYGSSLPQRVSGTSCALPVSWELRTTGLEVMVSTDELSLPRCLPPSTKASRGVTRLLHTPPPTPLPLGAAVVCCWTHTRPRCILPSTVHRRRANPKPPTPLTHERWTGRGL
jgi:hypothetical protein